jgi:cysteinyl-tRNA synthetase
MNSGGDMSEKSVFPWGELPRIKIYNSMTRREEDFPLPGEHPEVTIYVCGPTTYSFVHIGNMRGPIFYDVVRKIFKAHGYRVKFVTNFTDIDDKMIAEAKRVGEDDPIQLSARFVHEYYTDLFALGVEKADVYPKVSTHIPYIIEYIKLIMKNGHAYVGTDGSVYFDVKSYPDYLKLSGHSMESMLENISQGEEMSAKRDPRDFALWKAAKPGEPTWPFSQTDEEIQKFKKVAEGRPGWHIECSVMSAKYLGPSFDIHGGGKELKFPHHENELAQSKCGYPGEDFARIWMHNEWVVLPGGDKMAKSGESVLIRDVLKDHDPDTVRMFILSAHYRKEVEYSPERLDDQAKAKARIVETFRRLTEFLRWRAEERHENWLQIWNQVDRDYEQDPAKEGALKILQKFDDGIRLDSNGLNPQGSDFYLITAVREALYLAHLHFADDFDTQGAMGELFRLVTRINSSLDKMSPDNVYDFDAANIALGALVHLTEIFGILKLERDSLYKTPEAREEIAKGGGDAAKLAEVLLKLRDEARAEKNWVFSDKIRDRLSEIGAEVRDSKDGPKIVWK